jgi:oligopeptide/dipeptide ABC transporter ATP-binding protein
MKRLTANRVAPEPAVGSVLEVENLTTRFLTKDGTINAVDGVSFRVERGKTLGIIGESGSGKSVTARSIIRAVERPGIIAEGRIQFFGRDLMTLSESQMREVRGRDIGMIFQDPGASLNPVRRIGDQVVETYLTHRRASRAEAREAALETLALAGIDRPEEVFRSYPVDLSSGAKQRVMIAMAIVCRPALLIADEPTTMLGVRTQRQILEALLKIQDELQMAMILITHDFGVVSWIADDILVMYGGRAVEYAAKREILLHPRHHYTAGLIRSVPLIDERQAERFHSIAGFPPDLLNLPSGCVFHPRCEGADALCVRVRPDLVGADERPDHLYACHHPVTFSVIDEVLGRTG